MNLGNKKMPVVCVLWEDSVLRGTYCQIIQAAVGMALQVEVFKLQLEGAALAGLQLPVALGAMVVGHRVVGRSEGASGSSEVPPTTCRTQR